MLLTQREAEELRDSLQLLLANSAGRHEHISSEDYKKEITIAIHDPSSRDSFDTRSRTLIIRMKVRPRPSLNGAWYRRE